MLNLLQKGWKNNAYTYIYTYIYIFFFKKNSFTNHKQQFFIFMSDPKGVPGLLLQKISSKNDDINFGELPIYNVDGLTDFEFNMIIQNFFENDDGNYFPDVEIPIFLNKVCLCAFTFGYKKYKVDLLGEEKNELKKITIKFFNFLEKMMVRNFCYFYHHLDDDDIIYLIGNMIKNSNIIEHITFPRSFLKDNVFKILHDHIINHKNLKCLDFIPLGLKIKMSHNCVEYLDDIIKTSNIENISGLHDDDYKYFFESLLNNLFRGRNPDLDLFGRCINDGLVLKLGDMIKKKEINYLKEIDLSFNKITSKGVSILVDSLLQSKNENIIKIYMNSNKLDDNCIEKLGELIRQNRKVTHINIRYNDISDKGIEKLSEYIVGNVSIKSIDLYGNWNMTDASCNVIKHMVKSSFISSIGLNSESITGKNKIEIEELLQIPIEKREIPLITFQDVKSASKRMKE